MNKINIKALSVNRAYQGRRFKTPELKAYQEELAYRLPKLKVPKGKLFVKYRFGVSSKASDADNLCKAFQDTLSEQYGFNDKLIYKLEIEKIDIAKGKEFIEFDIQKYED
jgi:Holliday junction resolvase RusA-like endonuclease